MNSSPWSALARHMRSRTLLLVALLATAPETAKAQSVVDTTSVAERLIAEVSRLVPRPGPGVAQRADALLDSAATLTRSASVFMARARLGLTVADSALAYGRRSGRCADVRAAARALDVASQWFPAGGTDTPEVLHMMKRQRTLYETLLAVRRQLCVSPNSRRSATLNGRRASIAITPSRDTVRSLIPLLAFVPLHASVCIDYCKRWRPSANRGLLLRGSAHEPLAIVQQADTSQILSTLDPGMIDDLRVLRSREVVQCLGQEYDGGLIVVTLSAAGTKVWNARAHPSVSASSWSGDTMTPIMADTSHGIAKPGASVAERARCALLL